MDVLIREDRIAVEVKVTAPGRSDKQIKKEILVDINDYQQHPSVDILIVAVYDLADTFRNPTGFETTSPEQPTDSTSTSSSSHIGPRTG